MNKAVNCFVAGKRRGNISGGSIMRHDSDNVKKASQCIIRGNTSRGQ